MIGCAAKGGWGEGGTADGGRVWDAFGRGRLDETGMVEWRQRDSSAMRTSKMCLLLMTRW